VHATNLHDEALRYAGSVTRSVAVLAVALAAAACSSHARVAGVEIIEAPPGVTDVAAFVRNTAARVAAADRRLVVYVGATWCEPCQQIHAAALAHQLDAELPDLTLLAFDQDRDGAALQQAGYDSPLIPLFALPLADGRAGDRREFGGVHDGDNVTLLKGKLVRLLH
jgi:thiol-disulfide isomerase/thioredoxin